MKTTIRWIYLVALFGLSATRPAWALPIIGPGHTPTPVTAGDTLDLTVFIQDVVDLYAFQFSVEFDNQLLQATTVTEGPFLSDSGNAIFFPGIINNVTGHIDLIASSLIGPAPGITGSGDLVQLSFDVINSGTASVRWTNTILLNSNEKKIPHRHVPEPTALLLWVIGLSGMLTASRKI